MQCHAFCSQRSPSGAPIPTAKVWRPSREPYLKINMDAALNQQGKDIFVLYAEIVERDYLLLVLITFLRHPLLLLKP